MNKHLRDQRGMGMIIEITLAAVVLALVGLAFYQSKNASHTAAVEQKPATTAVLVESATKAVTDDSSSDTVLGTQTEANADEASAADSDVDNLGGSFDENSF